MKAYVYAAAIALGLSGPVSAKEVAVDASVSMTPTIQVDAPSGHYALDKKHASLIARINHMGLSEFTFRMNSFDVDLQFDADRPSNSTLTATVDMTSIDTAMPKFDEKLQGEEILNTSMHPTATYQSTSIERTGADTAIVRGNLTMLGVQYPMNLHVRLTGVGKNFSGKPTLGFSAVGQLTRSAYGVKKYLPNIGDTVSVVINAELNKK